MAVHPEATGYSNEGVKTNNPNIDPLALFNNKDYKEALMNLIDKHTQDPTQRAQRVWNSINNKKQFTQWDLASFCIETLGSISAEQEWMKHYLLPFARMFYLVHYSRALEIHNFSPQEAEKIRDEIRKLTEAFSPIATNPRSDSATPTDTTGTNPTDTSA